MANQRYFPHRGQPQSTSSAITNKAEESRSNQFDQLKPRFSKEALRRAEKGKLLNRGPPSVVEALMSCVAAARASIRPSKAPGPIEKRPRNIARSPLRVSSRRKKFRRIQKPVFSKNINSWFSPLILSRKG